MSEGLVYTGKVIALESIDGADFIESATVVCGVGGKWRGIVRKGFYAVGSRCIVYLPDALIQESEDMQFMAATNWRVKMRRFKGAPSEVVIVESNRITNDLPCGSDLTQSMGVTKYCKPVPAHLQGFAKGNFPNFIPKTDEPNYQRPEAFVDELIGRPYYITEKCDGSSTTAFKWEGHFGLCSRNLELKRDENNGYWQVAIKYFLEEKLSEGVALQWETCGPGIQSNRHKLSEIDGFAFSAYSIIEKRYFTMFEFFNLCEELNFPRVRVVDMGENFDKDVQNLGSGKYKNGHQREGVVVRSKENVLGWKPISFKVINLDYEK